VKLSGCVVRRCVAGLFLVLVAGLLFLKSVNAGLNHDEQQFVAPPVLIAQNGALPYRDFALLHMPNLVFVYAALDRLTSYHLLAARLFTGVCAWAIVALVFAACHRLLGTYSPWRRLALACSFAILLLFSTLALKTNGRTWNHDPALLLVLLGFLAYVVAGRGGRAGAWIFASGVLVGLAVGTRLTFAPIVAPFGLAILLCSQSEWSRRLKLAVFFSVGVLVAVLPALYFLGSQPEPFFYGNVLSQRLRLADPTDEWAHKTATLWRKVRFFTKVVMAGDAPLFLSFLAIGVPGLVAHFRRAFHGGRRLLWSGAILLPLLIPFVFAGALAPTRFQHQHYHALAPFLLIAACFGLSQWTSRARMAAVFICLLAGASVMLSWNEVKEFAKPREFSRWVPVKVHRIGREIARLAGSGRVLTLAPIYPLEGGAQIYDELAVGPFAYRLAHLMPPEKRRRVHVCAPEDLPALLEREPPSAILLGAEGEKLEAALRDHARSKGFTQARQFGKLTLWIAP